MFGSLSDYICMEFRIVNWESAPKRGKLFHRLNLILGIITEIQEIEQRRNIQVPRGLQKWIYTPSTCDRKFKEGVH
jgi:hypothetical protein